MAMSMRSLLVVLLITAAVQLPQSAASLFSRGDGNEVFSPCNDAKVRRLKGFTFGLVFSSKESFYQNDIQFSPCDPRLGLQMKAQVSVFRPYVDEISLLSVNTSSGFQSDGVGTHMVAFAGKRYAARSTPAFVSNHSYIITSFTLVLEFQKGILQNLYWKNDGCAACSGSSTFVCLDGSNCGVQTSNCISRGGTVDCSLGIQVAFSGTDQYDAVLNSWYEVSNLRQYSLYDLFSDMKGSFLKQFGGFLG